MGKANRLRRLRRDEAGMSLVVAGLGVVAFTAMTTRAVDTTIPEAIRLVH